MKEVSTISLRAKTFSDHTINVTNTVNAPRQDSGYHYRKFGFRFPLIIFELLNVFRQGPAGEALSSALRRHGSNPVGRSVWLGRRIAGLTSSEMDPDPDYQVVDIVVSADVAQAPYLIEVESGMVELPFAEEAHVLGHQKPQAKLRIESGLG